MELYINNKIFRNAIEELYENLGYNKEPLFSYTVNEISMDYEGMSKYAKTFNLKKSDILTIIKVLKQSAAYQRGSHKSMMTSRNNSTSHSKPKNRKKLEEIKFRNSESLIQTRQTHGEEVGILAEYIANELGLNVEFARLIGIGHDIGHGPNGHSGEKTLSDLGELFDCGYLTHNAISKYILERENIIEIATEEIKANHPNIKNKDINEFMRYVIDGIVCHNGEGIIGKIIPKDKTTSFMAQELRNCFIKKSFDKTLLPATMEGAIIRYADILAYTRSDLLDGLRLKDENGNKILNGFDNEYLSIIGTVLLRKNNSIEMLTLENKLLLEINGLTKIVDILENESDNSVAYKQVQKILDIRNEYVKDEFEGKIRKIKGSTRDKELELRKKELEILKVAYKKFEDYKIKYAKAYIDKINFKSDIKTKITNLMQSVFIKDLIETSKDKGYITMSPLMRRTLFTLRSLNSKKIIPHTRRKFESKLLPDAIYHLVNTFSDVLLKTGIAYQCTSRQYKKSTLPCYDENLWEENEHQLNCNKTTGSSYRRKIFHYYKNQKKPLNYVYNDVIDAIKDITKHDIKVALEEEPLDITEGLQKKYETKKIAPIRQKIKSINEKSQDINIGDLFKELLAKKLEDKNIERMIANKLAIEYIAGFTDNTLLEVLLDEGLIKAEILDQLYDRPDKETNVNIEKKVQELQTDFASSAENMIIPDNSSDGFYKNDGERINL